MAVLGSRAGQLRAATIGTARIDDVLRSGIAQRKLPAAVGMVADEHSILYSGAFGTRDSSGVPVAADSIFQIASMTKAITTVAALQLVEQGRVKLDEPVSKHLPQLAKLEVLDGFDPESGQPKMRPARTPVTLKHLLTHTSGICYDTWTRTCSNTRRKRRAESRPPRLSCSNQGRAGNTAWESTGQGVWWKP
jgi:methyl acetate hydrolase